MATGNFVSNIKEEVCSLPVLQLLPTMEIIELAARLSALFMADVYEY